MRWTRSKAQWRSFLPCQQSQQTEGIFQSEQNIATYAHVCTSSLSPQINFYLPLGTHCFALLWVLYNQVWTVEVTPSEWSAFPLGQVSPRGWCARCRELSMQRTSQDLARVREGYGPKWKTDSFCSIKMALPQDGTAKN